METSETQYFEFIWFFYTFCSAVFPAKLSNCNIFLIFQYSSCFHIHLQVRDYRGSLDPISSPSSSAPWFCWNDTLLILVMLYWGRQCRVNVLLPGQLFGGLLHFDDFTNAFPAIYTSFSVVLQDLVPMHIRIHAQDYGGVLYIISYQPCLVLSCRNVISSPWMSATVFPTGQINSIKDQLKLAGAASGVPGNHGHSWMPIYSSFQFRFYPMRLVVTNPAVPDGTFLLLVSFSSFIFNGSFFFWVVWVPPCSFHWVPCIRCWLAAYPKAQ